MSTPLHYLSLSEVAVLVREGELSPVELVDTMLARIDSLEPELHAFVRVLGDRARDRAKRCETELAAGDVLGPLHGVPIALKDLCDMRGLPTTAGTSVMSRVDATRDACVTERLEAAGAIVLGKLAMTEGAFVAHHRDVVPPVNPWDASAWTGISSSGSGVATAAGLCFGSLGSDTGGSIRYPSACNGLVGVKPTYGRVSRRGITTLCDTLDHIGPMARSAADAALLLGVIAGYDPGDPSSLKAPVPDYAAELGQLAEQDFELGGLRIGIDAQFAFADMDAEISEAVRGVADVLAEAGAVVDEVSFPDAAAGTAAWQRIGPAEIALAHEAWFDGNEDEYGDQLRGVIEAGRSMPATSYAEGCRMRTDFRARVEALFDPIDLLLCPALGVPLGANTDLSAASEPRSGLASRFTLPFDVSGSPAVTFPCGFREGVPIGAQLVGPQLGELAALRAVAAYERRTGWHTRHPGL